MSGPLAGVRVLELTTAVAGPVAGCTLADLGAEVIKIEAPNARAAAHAAAPPPVEGAPDHPWNRAPFFNDLHRGKRLLNMDLAHPEGRALFLRLVSISDVVLENFSPRVLGNLGIDYPQLCEVRPDIVLVSMPAFGKSGPYATRSSYGPGIDAMSGLSHLTGYPDRGPGKPAQFYCDYSAGLTAALVTMAALRHRRRTGEGQRIELSMLEGEMQLIAPALMDVEMNGRVPSRAGNRDARYAPQGVYRCGAGGDAGIPGGAAGDAGIPGGAAGGTGIPGGAQVAPGYPAGLLVTPGYPAGLLVTPGYPAGLLVTPGYPAGTRGWRSRCRTTRSGARWPPRSAGRTSRRTRRTRRSTGGARVTTRSTR